jgi:methylamine---glutamate N-methyltransferase subunit B
VNSLGSDCIEKPLRDEHKRKLGKLLEDAGLAGEVDLSEFSRYGSARRLYHFHMDNLEAY